MYIIYIYIYICTQFINHQYGPFPGSIQLGSVPSGSRNSSSGNMRSTIPRTMSVFLSCIPSDAASHLGSGSQDFPTEPTKQTGILWGYTGDTKGKCSYTLIHFANKQIDYDRLMSLEPFGTHISARQSPTWHLDLWVHAIHHFGLVYHRCTRTTL